MDPFLLPPLAAPVHDLGDNVIVRRVLPNAKRRAIGSFVFFDHIGPFEMPAGRGVDVRPHPHIGLATFTYLYEGSLCHRDSLGFVQVIEPGAVNWMISGRGVVHSERTPAEARKNPNRVFGLQMWVALPLDREESEPSFRHFPASEFGVVDHGGARTRTIFGEAYGRRSPVDVIESFLVDVAIDADQRLDLPPAAERGVYVLAGDVEVDRRVVPPHSVAVVSENARELRATTDAHVVLIGGAPLDAPRHVYWNFVSSSTERIERAKADWLAMRFGQVPGETEFIPLPPSAAKSPPGNP